MPSRHASFHVHFTDWFNVAPPVLTKLVLISPYLAGWVASFATLGRAFAERGRNARVVNSGFLSIDCIEGETPCKKLTCFLSPHTPLELVGRLTANPQAFFSPIDEVGVSVPTFSIRGRPLAPLAQMLADLGVTGTAKQVLPLEAEFLQTFRGLLTMQERVNLTVRGSVRLMPQLPRF